MALEHYTSGIGNNHVYVLQEAECCKRLKNRKKKKTACGKSRKRELRVTSTVAS